MNTPGYDQWRTASPASDPIDNEIEQRRDELRNDRLLFIEALQDDKVCDTVMHIVRICGDRLSWSGIGSVNGFYNKLAPQELLSEAVRLDGLLAGLVQKQIEADRDAKLIEQHT